MLKINQLHFAFDKSVRTAESSPEFLFDAQFPTSLISLITGASGAGKSTLLNLIAGFYQPQQGDIIHQSQKITDLLPGLRKIGFLFQNHNLFPHLNIQQNIALGLKESVTDVQNQQIDALLQELQLENYQHKLPAELSIGEQQRVALARIFLQIEQKHVQIILLDEPFAMLDKKLRLLLINKLYEKIKQHQLICLLVSHHPEEIANFAHHPYHLQNGRIESVTSTSI